MAFSVVLFDDYEERDHLLPLVATRPVGNLRVGILTLDRKWQLIFQTNVSYFTTPYLRAKYRLDYNDDVLVIKSSILPSDNIIAALNRLTINQQLMDRNGEWMATKLARIEDFDEESTSLEHIVFHDEDYTKIVYPEDVFLANAEQISFDVKLMKVENTYSSTVYNDVFIGEDIFIQQDVLLCGVVFDSSSGPIYIGKNAVIEPGVVVHGPAAIGDNCRVKTGTVIYSNVSIGDYTTICGELSNVVIWGNAAKGHAGYLGCAVVGEGCNLGAGTSNSNLKNTWSSVKLFDYYDRSLRDTGLLKCGVIIGDQAMLAIESRITTGTIIGVGAQVAMSKFIPKFVADFSWCTDREISEYSLPSFNDMMQRKAKAKNEDFLDNDKEILMYIHQNTENLRKEYNQH